MNFIRHALCALGFWPLAFLLDALGAGRRPGCLDIRHNLIAAVPPPLPVQTACHGR